MKNLLLLITLCLFSVISNAKTYYVSPTGNDANAGTITSPFRNWDKLSDVMLAGDIGYIRGGTYTSTKGAAAGAHCYFQNMHGTSSNWILIENYPGEYPILDCSNIGVPTALNPALVYTTNCSFVHFKGLHVRNLQQICCDQGISRGWDLDTSPNCILEQIEVDHIGGGGFHLINSNDVTYLNCDSHHNGDGNSGGSAGAWGGSDGFSCTGQDPSTRTTYTGCRSWLNSDDGWDNFKTDGIRTWNNCWSFWNGYRETSPGVRVVAGDGDGFKLGPANPNNTNDVPTTLRFLNNCFSFENGLHGFENNGAPTMQYQLYNCTAYKCLGNGFEFGYQTVYPGLTDVFKNNLAYANGGYQLRYCGANSSNTNNTWSSGTSGAGGVCGWTGGMSVTNADFQSISDVGVDGARQSDGSLPNLPFMHLSNGSHLIDAGVNVGLSYISIAPDLGAFESTGTSSNLPPVANAGADQIITLPTNSVSLTGIGTDPDGTISAYLWTMTSGPTGSTITTATSATTTVTGLVQGAYQFQLKVTDNAGASTTDIVLVTVNPAVVNTPPTANAGVDKTITLPTNSVSVTGSGTDPGGSISAYLWTKISGPAGGTIATATAATTSITSLIQGVYKFELKVTDNGGAIAKDTMQVTVNAAINQAPTANAGTDKIIVLPISTVSLTGTGTDPDGTIVSYAWSKLSGPAGGTITTPTTATTSVTVLAQGVYQFELKVTDNAGATGKDTVQVTVNAAGNQAPTANAGADKIIVLPISTVSLTGTGTDPDGTIASYVWSKLSGPTGGTITTPTTAATTITALAQGVYQFELKVTDNGGAIGRDTVLVTVNAASAPNNAYGGVRWAIPGTIQAENFDIGGENAGYYDNTAGNAGGGYRPSEDVDITTCSEGGYLVGWSLPGEWMNYSVNVTATGTYTLEARIACTTAGKSFRIEMDGITIATVNPPVTGGIQNWQTVTIPNINLTAGNRIMRIYWITGWGVNINYIKFTSITGAKLAAPADGSGTTVDAGTTVTTFPLPFSTSFTANISGKTTGEYNLTLVDISGKAVWKKTVTKSGDVLSENIYIGNLPNGVYILQVVTPDQKQSSHQLIKN